MKKNDKIREDVQTALDIINQFNKEWRERGKEIPPDIRLDFSRANLSGYSFMGMDFSHAVLEDVNLSGAILTDTIFCNARLNHADLSWASLKGANLMGANLLSAQLIGTVLLNANLIGADLSGANLSNANLSNADLSNVIGLTQGQIEQAHCYGFTKLPEGLFYPKHWEEGIEEFYDIYHPDHPAYQEEYGWDAFEEDEEDGEDVF